MQVELVNVFVQAAMEVLTQELGAAVTSGSMRVLSSAQTSEAVTVMVGISGDVRGMALLGMSEHTAREIVSTMLAEPVPYFDDMAQSGIAELGNVITGMATRGLEAQGLAVTISPPALVAGGPGIIISTVNFRRFVVQLRTPVGDIVLHAAVELAPGGTRGNGGNHHVAAPTVPR
jgi:chemotaxis protein CheX